MTDPAANYYSFYSSTEPLDAWLEPDIGNWLAPPSRPTPSRVYTYTSQEEPDLARIWTPESEGGKTADEHIPDSVEITPMGKRKLKRTGVGTPVLPPDIDSEPAEVPAEVPAETLAEAPATAGKEVVTEQARTRTRKDDFPDEEAPDEGVFGNDFAVRSRSLSPVPAPPKARSPSPPPPRKQQGTSSRPAQVNGVSSPALSALADDNFDDPGFDTRAWARNIPFGVSPPNAGMSPRDSPANRTPSIAGLGTSPSAPPFSLAGSPPSGMDRHRPPQNEDLRGGFGLASPGISPRPGHRLARQSADTHSLSISPRGRPVSMQYPGSTPVHRPQAHFRGLSEAEIGMMPSRSASGKRDGNPLVLFDQAYYEGHVGDVILAASGNTVHIHKLDREKLTLLGTLTGLRGTILGAKMLPPSGDKNFEPSIAIIVHGPMMLTAEINQRNPDMETIAARPYLSTNEAQTTVEVYGIKSSKHLATLYRSPAVNVGPRASPTDPATAIGALTVHANGSFITVTSGHSGEVYIFRSKQDGDEQSFVCLGKTWTSMPTGRTRSYSISSASSVSANSHDEAPGPTNSPEIPILSLSHRWLAVMPPPASSQTSIHGEVAVPGKTSREPPGLMSHTSPAQPSTNCEADTPLDEGLINKMARDAAQEAMKGARKAGEAGIQAFKNYWNKSDGQSTSDVNAYNASLGQQASSFPPTHAQDNLNRPAPSSTLVSIVDLERLSESNDTRPGMLVQPIATFPVRYGCSFLSFNPTGLSLFTSSAKGDVSFVWCLMRMIHGTIATPTGDVSAAENHASVRQIARFSRFTTSNIVDVIWTKPKGEKLAILTERGTVHIHDLPASAFRWPPPARHNSPASTPGAASDSSSQQTQAGGRFGSAISFVQGTAQSFSTAKLRSSLSGATFSGLAATAGAKGGRMVAAGFSRSMGAASGTVSNIRHMGENRISLPGGRKARITVGTVVLLSGKYQDAIAITGDGLIRLHAIRLSVSDGGKSKRSVAGEQISLLNVPKIEDTGNAAVGLDGLSARGQWLADTSAHTFKPGQMQPQPLSFAEIETSTPYRTFHNDHRVSMNTYADDARIGDDISEDWVFGDDIDTEPVDDDQLPAGSMHLGKGRDAGSGHQHLHDEETFAFEDDTAAASKPSKVSSSSAAVVAKKAASKKAEVAEPRYEDLIDMGEEDIEAFEAGVVSSESSGVLHDKKHASAHGAAEEEEEPMPFGENSEFGY